MKCKITMLITGFIILFSIQSYAAEEKITFTPTRESAQLFDITVSGKTDSQKVVVVHKAYLEEMTEACPDIVCENPNLCVGGVRSIKLYIAIKKCGNSGSADYIQSFKWYSYYGMPTVVQLYVRENPAHDEYTDYDSYKLAATEYPSYMLGPATEISIGKTTFEVSGTDTFTAHQVSLPGYDGLYWGTFQWNPYTLSWTLKDAGVEK